MSKASPIHVLNMSKELPQACPRHVPNMSQNNPKHVQKITNFHAKRVQNRKGQNTFQIHWAIKAALLLICPIPQISSNFFESINVIEIHKILKIS